MSVKYVCVLVDDFTSRSLIYDHVTFYDYGIERNTTFWDTWYYDYTQSLNPFDLGDVDSYFVNSSNIGYFHSSQFYDPIVTETGSLEPVLENYNYFYDLYMLQGYNDYTIIEELTPLSSSDASTPQHGDWVLEAFFQQLDDPSCVEIVAIDVDSSGGYLNSDQMNYLFSDFPDINGNGTIPLMKYIYNDAILRDYNPSDQYFIAGINASFGGGDPQ